jgi:hypothetical protein
MKGMGGIEAICPTRRTQAALYAIRDGIAPIEETD